jgi:hypothetical protein
MRYFTLLLLLSFFSMTMPSCAQKTASQKTTTKKVNKKAAVAPAKDAPTEAGPVISFERTACFGTCPSYVMQVYADGRVAYEGRRFVTIEGKKDLKLPAAAVTDMLQQARNAHFETFEKTYSSGVTDVPSTILTIRQPDGNLKKVTAEGNAPENVRELFTYFGNQLDALAQLNGTDR